MKSKWSLLWLLGALIAGALIAELYDKARYEWFAPDLEITCRAKEIVSEYDANEIAADNKYKNKRIIIGTIHGIGKTPYFQSEISLDGTDSLRGPFCYFGLEHNTAIAGLSKGQSVKVRGTVIGKTLGQVQVTNCDLQ